MQRVEEDEESSISGSSSMLKKDVNLVPVELRNLDRTQGSVADLGTGMMSQENQSQVRSTANMVTANEF